MNEGLISKRYAKALLEYAAPRLEDEAVYRRMRLLMRTLHAVPHLREILHNPVVPIDDKVELLVTASGGNEPERSFRRFVELVLRNERELLLTNMAISYINLYRKVNRITVVSIYTAVPVSEFVTDRIKQDVQMRTHGQVEMEINVDPAIEGGMIFQIDDLRLDASVTGQLEKIRRQFIQKNRIIV